MELLRSQFIKMYTFHLQITSWEKKKEYIFLGFQLKLTVAILS